MRISFEAPDEWEKLLDEQAAKDGHSNRAAVVRKIVNLFFASNVPFSAFKEGQDKSQGENTQEEQDNDVQ